MLWREAVHHATNMDNFLFVLSHFHTAQIKERPSKGQHSTPEWCLLKKHNPYNHGYEADTWWTVTTHTKDEEEEEDDNDMVGLPLLEGKKESNVHHERMDQPKRASLPKFADATVNDRQIRQELMSGFSITILDDGFHSSVRLEHEP